MNTVISKNEREENMTRSKLMNEAEMPFGSELINEAEMLKGNIARMVVTKDIDELKRMHEFAELRLQRIRKAREAELRSQNKGERQ